MQVGSAAKDVAEEFLQGSDPSPTGSSASSTAAYEPTPLRRTPRLAQPTRQTQPRGLTASSGGMSSQTQALRPVVIEH